MNKEKALSLLRAYCDELHALRSRVERSDSSNPFSDDDNKRYHDICLKLKDFTADFLMDNRRTSFQLVRQFTQSMSMSSGRPTAAGMGAYLESVDDLIDRLEASRLILRQHPQGERDPEDEQSSNKAQSSEAKSKRLAPLEQIAKRLHLVERQLREVMPQTSDESTFEKRVQTVFHSLLILHFEHVEREQWTPAYAEDGAVVSFFIPEIRTVTEIRKPPKSLEPDALKTQLQAHIDKYKSHPECDVVICFVYDPIGRTPHPRDFEKALSDSSGKKEIIVKVIPRD